LRRPRLPSLQGRVTALALLVVGTIWLAAAAVTWFEARHEAEEVFDAHLAQAASLLLAQTAHEPADDPEDGAARDEHAPTLHRYARKVAFQIWVNGDLRLHSQNAPAEPLSDGTTGFSDRVIRGERWRVFSARDPRHDAWVHVGERAEARHDLTEEIAGGLLRPLLIALPLLALLLGFAVRRAVAPLNDAAAELARRSPSHLAPLPAEGVPTEVRPLLDRINDLFERVARSIEQERRFTADAAHELRTPLAGLRAQAQVAALVSAASTDGAPEAAARRKALSAVVEGCDRMTRVIDQLLTLSRVDAVTLAPPPEIDLTPLLRETLAEMVPRALARGVEIELTAPERVPIRGHGPWLGILVRNVVENAVRYSPPAGLVRVLVETDAAGRATIQVTDDGPGVPAHELPMLGERFHRVPGVPSADGSEGSGLGLSICRRIVALHGGRMAFHPGPDGRGLRVRIAI
jgi:two-component system sensor histidine kinase QseC